MDFSVFLDFITATAVILGIIFGLMQLRHYHLSRKREAALSLLTSFQTGEFSQGMFLILELPKDLSKKEVEKMLGEDIHLVYLVLNTWESVGILEFNREVSIELVRHAYGNQILLSWIRLERYVSELRTNLQRQGLFEWSQWLSERMNDREEHSTSLPVYIAHREWSS